MNERWVGWVLFALQSIFELRLHLGSGFTDRKLTERQKMEGTSSQCDKAKASVSIFISISILQKLKNLLHDDDLRNLKGIPFAKYLYSFSRMIGTLDYSCGAAWAGLGAGPT